MRDPVHTEASAASLSKYKTTKASNTMVDGSGFTDKTDGVPTYPLQTLRDTDESKADLEQFDDENEKKTRSHRGDSVNRTPTRDFSNLSVEREPQGYKGVYIQSQIR